MGVVARFRLFRLFALPLGAALARQLFKNAPAQGWHTAAAKQPLLFLAASFVLAWVCFSGAYLKDNPLAVPTESTWTVVAAVLWGVVTLWTLIAAPSASSSLTLVRRPWSPRKATLHVMKESGPTDWDKALAEVAAFVHRTNTREVLLDSPMLTNARVRRQLRDKLVRHLEEQSGDPGCVLSIQEEPSQLCQIDSGMFSTLYGSYYDAKPGYRNRLESSSRNVKSQRLTIRMSLQPKR